MTRSSHRIAALAAFSLLLLASAAGAQERNGNFLDNIFKRDQQPAQQQQPQPQEAQPAAASGDSSELGVRIDRMENALRQMTGTIEQLQYQNQQLQMQLKRMQDDTEYRFQQLGSKAPPPAAGAAPRAMAPQTPVAPGNAPTDTAQSGRRSDAFDPARQPNAPHTLGNATMTAPPADSVANAPPVGAPGGRDAGAPLDLTTLSGNPNPPPTMPAAPVAGQPVMSDQQPQRSPAAPGVQLATLPPSASPKDEYELAYGYVLHKDYGLAEQAFRDFLRKYPDEKLQPDAQYWMGESQFQQQRYRDAAESFLAVSTKYEKSGKAPDALLRLGQSLAALSQKEAACATLAEVGRKYPHASASVKRGVTQEQKRTHC
jgi:tol-pal system protein YbgF